MSLRDHRFTQNHRSIVRPLQQNGKDALCLLSESVPDDDDKVNLRTSKTYVLDHQYIGFHMSLKNINGDIEWLNGVFVLFL